MAAGDAHTCALTSANNIVCWGANANGQLGIGSFIDQSLPVLVTGIVGNASAVVAGERHACALLDAGAVRCWGANERGQLGNPISGDQSAPIDVVGLPDPAIALATGANHTCAVLNQGSVYCFATALTCAQHRLQSANGRLGGLPRAEAVFAAHQMGERTLYNVW